MSSNITRTFNQRIVMLALLALLVAHSITSARTRPAQPDSQEQSLRDGQHDFDFNIGMWHSHIKRILDPFSGSTHAVVLDGTVIVRKIWGGEAQLEEIEAEGPNGHWEGMTLFLYNPQSHQ